MPKRHSGQRGLSRLHPDPDDRADDQERSAAVLAQTPAKRMGDPREIAEMVVWLCSERASYVTGAAYNVDGGWMAV